MTKLKIISKLWSAIYDLKLLISGTGKKTMEEIDSDLDILELQCRRYADTDDVEEIHTQEVLMRIRAEPGKEIIVSEITTEVRDGLGV